MQHEESVHARQKGMVAEAAEQRLTCMGKMASMDGDCKCCLTMVRMMAGVQCAGGLPCSPRACTSHPPQYMPGMCSQIIKQSGTGAGCDPCLHTGLLK